MQEKSIMIFAVRPYNYESSHRDGLKVYCYFEEKEDITFYGKQVKVIDLTNPEIYSRVLDQVISAGIEKREVPAKAIYMTNYSTEKVEIQNIVLD